MNATVVRIGRELLRFAAVGGLATLVAFFLFNILVHGMGVFDEGPLRSRVLVAYVIANLIGMLVSYSGTRSYVFADREPVHPDGGWTAYFVINTVTMALPIACLWISRNLLELDDPISDNIAANGVGLLLGWGARFYLFRKYVFRRGGRPAGSDPAAGAAGSGRFSAATDRSSSSPADRTGS